MRLHALLPNAARILTRTVPTSLQRAIIEDALNHALAEAIADARFDFMEARVLAVAADDAGVIWPMTLIAGRLLVLPPQTPAETTIHGPLSVFVALVRGQLDPDTAFFQRELIVEGDTELGLAAKNTLDALDPETLPAPVRRLLVP
ncbi:hypothetical protein KBTX_00965 [wastewater metagenome]|uniref:SCP2 domain-containing protein n=2 Tax=unclassified sequences TaxID=12908 RepID=A0A5B8RD71_9ZZZZ|nr:MULTISPECIES: SCP2 sterol-binding domain-containing protein [Arhodomonas]MCS4503708.1 SCP2 sterol-binding domain-containing protein [Arhodomonas aquaeolei]QEA04657.1 hypothetical protein KBTEX_00965 [uncultured organism]